MAVLTLEYVGHPEGPGTNFTVTYGEDIPLLELRWALILASCRLNLQVSIWSFTEST